MTDYLFAVPSVMAGIASCIDLFGVYNTYNESTNDPDKRALYSDCLAIKNDFNKAFAEVINCG